MARRRRSADENGECLLSVFGDHWERLTMLNLYKARSDVACADIRKHIVCFVESRLVKA
jgi:hypothetical protein